MEKKERFELFGEHCIKDNNPDARPQLFDACVACVILNEQYKHIKDLEAKLAESEKKVKHWHNLYNERDKQFQSVRQRYHLLNKLQSNYDKKDKLHLAYMQCAELVDENEQLKQQLHELQKKIVEEIRKEIEFPLYVHPDFDEFECLFDIDKLLDTILKKYGVEDE